MTGSLLQKRRLGGLCALAVLAGQALSACSSGNEGGDGSTAAPPSGVSGTGGGRGGQGGASNGSGGAVSGSAGKAGGSAGAAGKATGGAAGGGGGKAGAGGGGGKAGASGGAGKGGSAGVDLSCQTTNDCLQLVPETKPASCATAVCDQASKKCRFKAKDFDGDGHATTSCKSLDASITIELGDDCNDDNEKVHPGAWDGPEGEGHPDGCSDEDDTDCNGKSNDGVLSDSSGCKCVVGDVHPCSADSGGKPIVYPGGEPQGECQKGAQTCVEQNGKTVWGPCSDAVGPTNEICDGLDNDCDGLKDDDDPDVLNQRFWYCDGDNDGFAAVGAQAVKSCDVPSQQCAGVAPSWKQDIPTSDCDDGQPDVNPNYVEVCDGKDNDCKGGADDGITCQCNPNDKNPDGTAKVYPCGNCNEGTQVCTAAGSLSECTDPDANLGTGCDAGNGCSGTIMCDGSCSKSGSCDAPGQWLPAPYVCGYGCHDKCAAASCNAENRAYLDGNVLLSWEANPSNAQFNSAIPGASSAAIFVSSNGAQIIRYTNTSLPEVLYVFSPYISAVPGVYKFVAGGWVNNVNENNEGIDLKLCLYRDTGPVYSDNTGVPACQKGYFTKGTGWNLEGTFNILEPLCSPGNKLVVGVTKTSGTTNNTDGVFQIHSWGFQCIGGGCMQDADVTGFVGL